MILKKSQYYKEKLAADQFEMKNLSGLKYFLGIEVARSKRGIFLSQRKYVLDLLSEVGMLDCKPVDTPKAHNHKLTEYPDQVPADKIRYQKIGGEAYLYVTYSLRYCLYRKCGESVYA